MDPRALVLVEGESDRCAVEAIARRRGRDLAAEGIEVVAIGGSKNIRPFLARLGPRLDAVRVAGLCDAAEVGDYRRALEAMGFGTDLDVDAMEALGFFVCHEDLEDELLRAVGIDGVLAVVEAQGELRSFRTLQKQPAQQGRSVHDQLRRFMGSKGGRKVRYGTLLADAVDLARVPRPLDRLLSALAAVADDAEPQVGRQRRG